MTAAGSPPARPAVVFLLPVWGERFVSQFLDLGLRTLLAPGNIPAVAEACDCSFRIFSSTVPRVTSRYAELQVATQPPTLTVSDRPPPATSR